MNNNQLPEINHETVVLTEHYKHRNFLLNVSNDMIIEVMQNPAQTQKLKDGTIEFTGESMGTKLLVVTNPNVLENKWLVTKFWVRGEGVVWSRIIWGRRRWFALPIPHPLFILIVLAVIYIILRG